MVSIDAAYGSLKLGASGPATTAVLGCHNLVTHDDASATAWAAASRRHCDEELHYIIIF